MRPNVPALALLSLLVLAACGDEPARTPGEVPEGKIDPALVGMQDWEWYAEETLRFADVEGRVTTPDGEAAAGASVTVHVPPLLHVAVPKPVATVTADDEGRFRAEDVPANAWVFARAPGFAGRIATARELYFGGEAARELRLRRAAPLRGVVRDREGRGVDGVTVLASTNGPDWFAAARTDREGRYEIADAPEERVQLGIIPGRYFGTGVTAVPNRDDPVTADIPVIDMPPVVGRVVDDRTGNPVAGAVVLAVVDGQVVLVTDEDGTFRLEGVAQPVMFVRGYGYAEVPVQLNPVREEIQNVRVAMPRSAVLRGRVTSAAGEPIGGARVKAVVQGPRGPVVHEGPLTAEDGTFDFSWLPVSDQGTVGRLAAMKPGWLPAVSEEFRAGKGVVSEGLDLTITRESRIRGVVRDHEGRPVPGAQIDATFSGEVPAGYEDVLRARSAVLADEEGAFLLAGLRGGRQELTVSAAGHVPFVTWVEVAEGETRDDLELALPRGEVLAGRVAAAGDTPPDEIDLVLTAPVGSLRVEVPVEENGAFRVHGLSADEYLLSARADGYEPAFARVRAGREDLTLVLRALSRLEVTVEEPPEGELTGWLEVRGVGGDATINNPLRRPLEPGSRTFSFENLAAGNYVILVEAGDYWAKRELLLARGRPAKVGIELERGGTVEGQVSMPDGRVVSGVGVAWTPVGGGGGRGVDTNQEGRYRFRGIPPGDVKVRVHPQGYPPTERVVSVNAGETAVADLVLRTGGRLEVLVRNGEGEPVPDARIGVLDEEGRTARFWVDGRGPTETGRDGVLRLIGLLPGTYRIVAIADAGRGDAAEVAVRDGEETKVEIRLTK